LLFAPARNIKLLPLPPAFPDQARHEQRARHQRSHGPTDHAPQRVQPSWRLGAELEQQPRTRTAPSAHPSYTHRPRTVPRRSISASIVELPLETVMTTRNREAANIHSVILSLAQRENTHRKRQSPMGRDTNRYRPLAFHLTSRSRRLGSKRQDRATTAEGANFALKAL
jgi:hypothetical protein